jgi:hypothetical protein
MKHAAEMGSGEMIYISCITKIGSSIQNFLRGVTHIDRQKCDLISQILSFTKQGN